MQEGERNKSKKQVRQEKKNEGAAQTFAMMTSSE